MLEQSWYEEGISAPKLCIRLSIVYHMQNYSRRIRALIDCRARDEIEMPPRSSSDVEISRGHSVREGGMWGLVACSHPIW